MGAWGEVQKQDVKFFKDVPNPERPDLNDNPFKKCCFEHCVFADLDSNDTLRNDFSAPHIFLPLIYTPTITLEKKSNGAWSDVANLNGNTYGKLHTPVEENGVKLHGYRIEWKLVLSLLGTGCYRVRFDYSGNTRYSMDWSLMHYSKDAVDRSTRFTFTKNSVVGGRAQKQKFSYVGLEWEDQLRICDSIFGNKSAPFTVESTRYKSGYERTYKKEFREEYELLIRKMDLPIHDAILYDVLQSDDISIVDYNSENFNFFNELEVEVSGDFTPEVDFSNAYPSLLLKFMDKYNNHRKLYS